MSVGGESRAVPQSLAPFFQIPTKLHFISSAIQLSTSNPFTVIMWLLNCSNYRLESHDSTSPPKYWILSHTWGADEVTFQDMQDLKAAAFKEGFQKIEGMCKLASAHGIQYVWIDTCCIDKTSSAELSESINSMFSWYGQAELCIAFLADLATTGSPLATKADLEKCRWFTRGWTLQELLAPVEVEFYDCSWNPRGSRKELCLPLSEITQISSHILATHARDTILQKVPVATRLSWAANRQTTRDEDKAYCLLGIFGVHMPLLYGERNGAFIRLQEAIAQKGNDMSLFAWVRPRSPWWIQNELSGLLASDPSHFAHCTGMERIDAPLLPPVSWTMTNAGLETTTALDRPGDEDVNTEYTQILRTGEGVLQSMSFHSSLPWSYRLLLHCRAPEQHHAPSVEPPVLAIWLCKTNTGFLRYRPTALCAVQRSAMKFDEPRPIRIATILSEQESSTIEATLQSITSWTVVPNALRFHFNLETRDIRLDCKYHPPHLWDNERLSGVEFMTVNATNNPQFSVAEISISNLPGSEPFSRTCWLFCGFGAIVGYGPWAELVCEEADGSVSLLGGQHRCNRSVLTNPFALFGLFGKLNELGITPNTGHLAPDCTVPCTPTLSVQLSASEFTVDGGYALRRAHESTIKVRRLLDVVQGLPYLPTVGS